MSQAAMRDDIESDLSRAAHPPRQRRQHPTRGVAKSSRAFKTVGSNLRIAVVALIRRRLQPLDLLEALEAGVTLEERPIDREVVGAGQPRLERHHHHLIAELLGDVQAIQPLAVTLKVAT